VVEDPELHKGLPSHPSTVVPAKAGTQGLALRYQP
jgi:hypothetical protein